VKKPSVFKGNGPQKICGSGHLTTRARELQTRPHSNSLIPKTEIRDAFTSSLRQESRKAKKLSASFEWRRGSPFPGLPPSSVRGDGMFGIGQLPGVCRMSRAILFWRLRRTTVTPWRMQVPKTLRKYNPASSVHPPAETTWTSPNHLPVS